MEQEKKEERIQIESKVIWFTFCFFFLCFLYIYFEKLPQVDNVSMAFDVQCIIASCFCCRRLNETEIQLTIIGSSEFRERLNRNKC